MTEIIMPRLSDSMEEGTVIRWVKADGDEVLAGDELVEVETDKATIIYDSPAAGFLRTIVGEGETVGVGHPIARLASDRDSLHPVSGTHVPDTAPSRLEAAAERAQAVRGPKASPVARRIARELGLDLAAIAGSGPGGRIVKDDVERVAACLASPRSAPSSNDPPNGHAPAPVQGVQELTSTQRVIARRMAESRATIPDFSVEAEVDMERAAALRAELKETSAPGEVVPSLNDFVIRACALALAGAPKVNGSYRDGRFELHDRVDIGLAVAVREALIVPTIRDADQRSLAEIAAQSRTLADRARTGQITPAELAGGTFTVSNLGMHGIRSFVPVINPPQAAILGVGMMERRVVVNGDEIVARKRMTVTLCCDHRIIYGADAAGFLEQVRLRLEQPLRLLT